MGQERLSLNDALRLAQQNNGTIASARKQVDAAKARLNQARAAFYPTITPSISWTDQKEEFLTGAGLFGKTLVQSGLTTQVDLKWQILDSGERQLSLLAASRSLDAQTFDTLQTLRQTLFNVYSDYFDVIRNQELVKNADAEVERARKASEQADAQFKAGDLAEKDTLQPKADYLNAKVSRLTAQSRLNQAEATFKAAVGWDANKPLPSFEEISAAPKIQLGDLSSLLAEGVTNRADLIAQRKRLEQQEFGLDLTKRNAGLQWSLDFGFNRQFGPDNINNRTLSLTASYPLFDGNRSHEAVKEGEANLESSKFGLTQQERDVRAEIESAFHDASLTGERVDAAKSALEAAQANYDKVNKAQELGAAAKVEIFAAQATLVQAETNYVEAIYDDYIAQARLSLVVGRRVPGEELAP